MKIILFTICVLMAIHTCTSLLRPAAYYDSVVTCFKNITLNQTSVFDKSFGNWQNILKNKFNIMVDASICALKKDGAISQEDEMTRSDITQYCSKVFVRAANVQRCQKITKYCTDLECGGPVCTSEEVKRYVKCALNNKILSVLEFPLLLM
ncbi:uncharacterized protein LOC109860158 [Pseudomyrmex gracilis]|uniref:uncharacterized protein LOC109860158 n=1 Tax=Pseudomyrmex gracilis TaxID=219809 RepID=UPI000994C65B|nr:uncharacterized protein LOC109860158 [Pseudomyrmex gracilis]